ncbi:DNA-formamidopyrimidine glycosylase [Eikenella corrodens]|uniref:Formamidopyrimidine-DNA glycosylase n=1 Tax=Eikenella corrodens TaxID=539 RepID=A0A1A9RCF3_EIKCO|nr:bifunctional DNA-formamidopyrimidine glycosylase/DNA-(apurinic or apyrimidinic site) lyase [Eikenella corrodens]OAM16139.1 DNA-formamidopyrimidine glycosylase [Eikenella corrodens]
MPELPEVETTRRGIQPYMQGKTVAEVVVRQPKLRWPVSPDLAQQLASSHIVYIHRRAKYLLFEFPHGVMLLHLGMSGSLRVYPNDSAPPPEKHDHIDIITVDQTVLRLRDPRRFGLVLWFAGAAEQHPLLQHLGPEPLQEEFTSGYLKNTLSRRKSAIKTALMDNKVVVGVGNIYANEALFAAGILPTRRADRVSAEECRRLVTEIRNVLHCAIEVGGSSLRDFVHSDGQSGYFQQQYHVYGREGEPCHYCGTPIARQIVGQRSSFYCPKCQR